MLYQSWIQILQVVIKESGGNMEENDKREDIRRSSNQLQQMRDEISKSYSYMNDSLEERHMHIQRIMSSGALNKDDVDFYQEQRSRLYRMMNDCDYEKNESLRIVNKALTENEEEMRRLQDEEEQEEKDQKE